MFWKIMDAFSDTVAYIMIAVWLIVQLTFTFSIRGPDLELENRATINSMAVGALIILQLRDKDEEK